LCAWPIRSGNWLLLYSELLLVCLLLERGSGTLPLPQFGLILVLKVRADLHVGLDHFFLRLRHDILAAFIELTRRT
jgi:hypothetical protein